MRRLLTVLLTFLGGAYFVFEFLLPARAPDWLGGFSNPLTPWFGLATDLVIVLATMAFLLGPINLFRAHITTLLRRQPNWFYSLVFLVFLAASLIVSIAKEATGGPEWQRAYNVLFYGVVFGFGTASMGLLTFYLVSAAYRSFRLSGLDAALMFLAATIVLLGRAPLGDWLTADLPPSFRLSTLADWVMNTPNAAVQRAVILGTFAGAFAAALRYWLSIGTRRE